MRWQVMMFSADEAQVAEYLRSVIASRVVENLFDCSKFRRSEPIDWYDDVIEWLTDW